MVVSVKTPKKVVTVGGWDPCGAFGVPADIKTFAALGCHGMGVLSVATVQNSVSWFDVSFLSAKLVEQQLDAVLSDYGADALKTGFLGRPDIIAVVAQKVLEYKLSRVVVDPVLLNGAGEAMFGLGVKEAYEAFLFPLASVLTPNLRELNYLLTGRTTAWSGSLSDRQLVVDYYAEHFGVRKPLLTLKGLAASHEVASLSDGWFDGQSFNFEEKRFVDTANVSGSGDTFSAALTAGLGWGLNSKEAMRMASRFTQEAIERSASWRLAEGPGPVGNFKMHSADEV